MINIIHEITRARWEAGVRRWAECADNRGLWRRCPEEPGLVLSERELFWCSNISGRKVCVLGSGDNQVVFALAGMEALVTSVDISENQLNYARNRAVELELIDSIDFICADVTDLSVIADESFDYVYTGGHVAVWISDLNSYYGEATRVLKPGGE